MIENDSFDRTSLKVFLTEIDRISKKLVLFARSTHINRVLLGPEPSYLNIFHEFHRRALLLNFLNPFWSSFQRLFIGVKVSQNKRNVTITIWNSKIRRTKSWILVKLRFMILQLRSMGLSPFQFSCGPGTNIVKYWQNHHLWWFWTKK